MSTETLVAHCGACAGRMILVTTSVGVYFVCIDCGTQTDLRPTAAEAAADVVWVAVRPVARRS